MKKTKTLAKVYDDKLVYYDNALYKHEHKENSTKDLVTNIKFDVKEDNTEVAAKLIQNNYFL
ncbi:MAG: hypothetical protein JEZ08_13420 [Clostridiales bacterium]|nr:hypothetical protein [Clostridiales bacterium]